MSERTTNENARRNRRRRLGRRLMGRNKEAVSPVVATLILILVAVAAAAALYLWLSGWQAGVTKSIGNPGPQYSIKIGGSTTVYPFDQQVVPWFEQNNSAVVVSDNVGGSGAGILAVCAGQVDIGASSRALTATDLATCPALQNAVQTRLAIAAIVPIVSSTTTTGFTASSGWLQSVLASIYQVNGGGSGIITTPVLGGTNGLAAGAPSAPCTGGVPGIAGNCYAWKDVPQNWGTGTCITGGSFASCTYSALTSEIHLYDRADNSGTEANFLAKLLGGKCGSDNQLDSCNVKTSASLGGSFTGNPSLTSAVGKDPLGLGFTDVGQATSAVFAGQFQNASQTLPVAATTSTIKAAAASTAVAPFAGNYGGWTPLEYITIGTPTGEVQRFIQFAMDPNVNQVACTLNGYISVYS
ncbi:MAG: substrate-binding domain-containing protein [Thermoplasmata archaeon]|nr:substrate-binding domain-containing protein [Thermoplasmata archaeon]